MHQRLLNGGLLAAIVMAGVVGCGGSDNGEIPRRDTVPVTGGVTTRTAVTTADIPASNNAQTVQVTINGQASTAVLPHTDAAIPSGSTLVVVPQGTRFFTGLRRVPSRAPGNVYVDNVNTGVSVQSDGSLDGNIVVQNNHDYDVFAEGPFHIDGENRRLDISEGFEFNVVVRQNHISLPEDIDGTIPSNGGTATDIFLEVTYPAPFDNDDLNLTVIKSNGNNDQSRTLQDGHTTFRDFVPNVIIPDEGIQRIKFQFTER